MPSLKVGSSDVVHDPATCYSSLLHSLLPATVLCSLLQFPATCYTTCHLPCYTTYHTSCYLPHYLLPVTLPATCTRQIKQPCQDVSCISHRPVRHGILGPLRLDHSRGCQDARVPNCVAASVPQSRLRAY